MNIKTAFKNGCKIPDIYTCRGSNISPPLHWEDAPDNTKSFVFIFEDIDVQPKPWTHWLLFNIPVSASHIPEGMLPEEGTEALANNHTFGYEGPHPRYFQGIHHYRIRFYALDTILQLPAASEKNEILDAMEGHVIASAELTGLCISP